MRETLELSDKVFKAAKLLKYFLNKYFKFWNYEQMKK